MEKITNTFSDSNYIYSNTKSFRQVSKHTTIICKPGGPRRSTLPSWPIGYFFPFYPEIPRINPNTTIVWSKFLSRYTLMYISLISPVSLSAEDAQLSLGNHSYPLEFHADSSYTVDIHLSQPARGGIGVSPIQLMPEDSLIIRNRRSLLHRPRPGSCRLLFQSGTLQTSQFLFQLHKYMTFNDLQRIYRNTRAG